MKDLGRVDSSVRSADQTALALFWTDSDIPQWNRNLLRLAEARGLTAIETARMLAMAHVAGGDAMIGCFDAKYHYLSWRPLHAIRRADTDDNPLTVPDPAWQPLRNTPNHPEYPSAHACHTTAIAEALESFFGPGRTSFSLDSLVTGETRYYDRFKDAVEEVNNARVWAGFHFRYADEDGSKLGRKVARFVVTTLLPAARLTIALCRRDPRGWVRGWSGSSLGACLSNVNTLLARSSFRHYSDELLGQTELPAKRRETRVTAQAVERWLDVEKDQPGASFLAGALQPLQCAAVFAKPGVDERQCIRGDVFARGPIRQFRDDLVRIL